MTKQELKQLKVGDIIRHEIGSIYQVTKVVDSGEFRTTPYIVILLLWSHMYPHVIGREYWMRSIDLINYEIIC